MAVHRYFFDLEAEGFDARDDVGVVLADVRAAHAEAMLALRSCASGPLPCGQAADLALKVRDETGQTVMRLALGSIARAEAANARGLLS
ncbi:hypothetical protein M446_0846 [Methylobacterium sp. 4-46]|uniref:DUF6894 family protein n=1 Tax=unclassified Methylobacterium TaxID=2615210 RepID=UPI000165C93C|nr:MULTISPECIES: hypothetical protein [Methylobacterium]ACA15399.1 hypothetical protein M446_0846 [Methylobacterium sp. 4-46]WFT81119.1 hypothetical protein QA634_04235 [Methylobacterium nodulans]